MNVALNTIIKQLRSTLGKMELALSSINEAIVWTDEFGTVQWCNHAFDLLVGKPHIELLNKNILKVLFLESKEKKITWQRHPFKRSLTSGEVVNAIYQITRGAENLTLDVRVSCLQYSKKTKSIVAVIRDITELKVTEKKLKHIARHDVLTDLPNRLQFNEVLGREMSKAKRNKSSVVLFLVDIDNFKLVNDTYGHYIGDLLLQEFAHRLRFTLRVEDFVARIGGDEFVILLTSVEDEQQIRLLAQKLLHDLSGQYLLDNLIIESSISIGIANIFSGIGGKVNLLKNADIALYRAKEVGRKNYQYFTGGMGGEHLFRLELRKQIEEAIEKHDFFLMYQPIFSLPGKKIIGMEALLRWRHSKYGVILPEIFIPIIESKGLMSQIDLWVMQNACEQFVNMCSASGSNYKLNVNLSPSRLFVKKHIESITNIIKKSGIQPQQIELEITESEIMTLLEYSNNLLDQLKEIGLNIAIDDFGKGYSSLTRLKDLPIDTLKIDQSFIQDVEYNGNASLIIQSLLVLADSLKINVIVEGVETAKQLEYLVQNGCPSVQGNYLSNILSAKDIAILILRQDASEK